MSTVRIESVAEPFASHPTLAFDAASFLARADVMGFLPVGAKTDLLDLALVMATFKNLGEHGIQIERVRSKETPTTAQLQILIQRALEVSETSAMPAGEWRRLGEILGEPQLAELLGVSESSVRRYKTEKRPTPQEVAERLHELALIIADLAGAYNDFGIRRWFHRPRVQLNGKSPLNVLRQGWDPYGIEVKGLRDLAGALVGSPAS